MLLTIGIGLLSLASALLPALGLLALYVLAETWRPPIGAPGWFRTAYRLSRYYVFTVLIIGDAILTVRAVFFPVLSYSGLWGNTEDGPKDKQGG